MIYKIFEHTCIQNIITEYFELDETHNSEESEQISPENIRKRISKRQLKPEGLYLKSIILCKEQSFSFCTSLNLMRFAMQRFYTCRSNSTKEDQIQWRNIKGFIKKVDFFCLLYNNFCNISQ